KAGQVRFRTDKNGIIHTSVGKIDFEPAKLKENVEALLSDLRRLKPSTSKGVYVKRVTLSSTMGPGLQIDQASFEAYLLRRSGHARCAGIGVPAWRGLSKTVGGASLKRESLRRWCSRFFTESDTKTTSGLGRTNR